jgi:type I restriction enzyme, S subunit
MTTHRAIRTPYSVRPLGSVVEFLDSMRRPVKAGERAEGSYPYFGANGQQGTIDGFIFDEPLVLLAEDGGHFDQPDRGIAYTISGKTWVNNHAHVLRPRPGLDLDYLCRVLKNRDVTPYITGSTRAKLTQAGASRITIPVPPLDEQRRIADVLDRADALRAQRRRAIALLDDLAQSIFLDMFGDPVRNHYRWGRTPLRDLVQRIESGNSPRCLDRPVAGDEWGVLKLGAVTSCVYKAIQNKALPPGESPSREHEVRPGDLLLSRKNTRDLVGACALVLDTPPRLLMPDLIFRLALRTGAPIDKVYLHRLLIQPTKRTVIRRLASGTASSMPNISKARLLDLPIEVPPLDLQRTFSERIRAIESLKEVHEASLVELDALFEALQYRAFRGELWEDTAD